MSKYNNIMNKQVCKNNNFKTSALIWNEELEWPAGSYSISVFKITLTIVLKNMRQLLIILHNDYIELPLK